MRRLLLLTGAIVLVDTAFFTALTPLLPHYVDKLDLGKAGAGVLQAMYPAGALLAAIPGGMAVARFGVRRTVLTGLTLLAITTTGIVVFTLVCMITFVDYDQRYRLPAELFLIPLSAIGLERLVGWITAQALPRAA